MYNQKPLLGTLPNYIHPLIPNVAAWLMNEGSGKVVSDLINRNHGTLGAGAASPSWGYGGLYFDGGDYIDCGNPTSGIFNFGTEDFTFCAIINTSNVSTHQTIMAKETYDDDFQWRLTPTTPHQKMYIAAVSVEGTTILQTNTWYFVAVTRINRVAQLYTNGKPDGPSSSGMSGSINNAHSLFIGARVAIGHPFIGTIKTSWIYNRGLSASELRQLYVNPYCWLAQPMGAELMYAAPPIGAIMNQFQRANLGADLYDGVLIT